MRLLCVYVDGTCVSCCNSTSILVQRCASKYLSHFPSSKITTLGHGPLPKKSHDISYIYSVTRFVCERHTEHKAESGVGREMPWLESAPSTTTDDDPAT